MSNGQSLNTEMVQSMKNALAFSKPDIEGFWNDHQVALGAFIKYNTPESHHEKQPLYLEDNQKIMVVSARIDNRDELCSIFNIPLIHRDNFADSHYVKLAYEKWGENSPEHLLGDWSFAVYDKISRRLFVARDHCGITALYYYSCPQFFAFSSSPKGLLALKEIPKEINEFRIAQILVAWPSDGEQTCYQNIFNLLPGAYLTLQDGKLNKIRYWELKEQEELILPKEQDYYDRFLEIFIEAVKCRLRTTKNIGISLSGGLDSTSIAAIAAIELAKQNKELYAFTSVPLYKDYKISKKRNGDEGELAGLMAKKYSNIRHFLVNAEGYDPIECIKKSVEILDEPMHAAANQYWIQAINDKAIENNVGVLLNGQGGNGVISWPTAKVALYNQKGLKYYKHLLKIELKDIYDCLFHNQYNKFPFLRYSDINPEFAKRLDLTEKMKLAGHDPKFRKVLPFKEAQRLFILQLLLNVNVIHHNMRLWYELYFLDPTFDKRLAEFSCSMPKILYNNDNYKKILVLKSFKESLPKEILFSQQRGLQAIDINNRTTKLSNKTELFTQFSSLGSGFIMTNNLTNHKSLFRSISTLFFLKQSTINI
jgi:asparagine synthase (glutamine-hydrolysing)